MYVYFIRTGDALKVGIANDINKRMVNIQVGNPHKIEVLHAIDTSEDEARKIESHIHELFKKTHLNGEWFHATQFMITFIDHIKNNGWESHSDWIEKQYNNKYSDVLKDLKNKIEDDIFIANMVSLEMLKQDLGILVNTIYAIPSMPTNMAEALRKWIGKRKEPFLLRDVYMEFGLTTKKNQTTVRVNLLRLISEGIVENCGKGMYRKKTV